MTFTLKHPLAGFENINTMKLTKLDDYFYQLEDTDSIVSFTLVDPFKLRDYDIELANYYKILLEFEENTQFFTLCSMIISKDVEDSRINFIAPFIFNVDKKLMLQVLLDTSKYPQLGMAESISDFLN